MIQRKKDVDGDLHIPGSITVLGGINSPAYSRTVTKLVKTGKDVTTVSGQVAVVEGAVADLDDRVTEIETNPPAAARYLGRFEAAHPGSFIAGDWWTVFDTDDTPIQRGVWYSNAGTPARITTDSSFTLQAKLASTITDIAWAEANGYGVTSDYGVENLYQVLGAVSAFIENLFAQAITVPTGGRIRYETGAGVNKRAVQLADEKIDWIDTPDTTPSSPEQLRARIGRLGVNGAILMNGEFMTTQENPQWGAEALLYTGSLVFDTFPAIHSSKVYGQRAAYHRSASDNYLVERVWTGTSWGAETVIASAICQVPCYWLGDDGLLRLAYSKGGVLVERIMSGSSWGPEVTIGGNSPDPVTYCVFPDGLLQVFYRQSSTTNIYRKEWNGSAWSAPIAVTGITGGYINIVKLKNGEIWVAYTRASDGYAVERRWEGSSWGSESIINAASSYSGKYVKDLMDKVYYFYVRASDNNLVQKRKNGSWGSEAIIALDVFGNPSSAVDDLGNNVIVYTKSNGQVVYRSISLYAQLGAGIVESGSNANGSYIKFSDGTMQCWAMYGTLSLTATFHTTGYYNFPATFIANPVVNWGLGRPSTSYTCRIVAVDISTTQTRIVIETVTQTVDRLYYRAIGRWK